MRRAVLIAAAAVAALAGCGGSSHAPAPKPAASPSPFPDRRTPLHFVDRGQVQQKTAVAVHDVSFAGPGGRIPGFLALPGAHRRRQPAVIFLHGSGADRGEFLPTAEWLAARGAVALTITEPSSSAAPGPGGTALATLHHERVLAAEDVVAARRAVDLLRSRPDVDPSRIGLLGWSAGARTGAILAGVEPRIRAFVLMSAGAVPVSEYAAAAPPSLRQAVTRELSAVDPLRWIAHGRPGTILLQDGRHDGTVPQPALRALAAAAPPGTRLRWYDAGHPLNVAAERDQLAWLTKKLGIAGPRAPGAPIGPS